MRSVGLGDVLERSAQFSSSLYFFFFYFIFVANVGEKKLVNNIWPILALAAKLAASWNISSQTISQKHFDCRIRSISIGGSSSIIPEFYSVRLPAPIGHLTYITRNIDISDCAISSVIRDICRPCSALLFSTLKSLPDNF